MHLRNIYHGQSRPSSASLQHEQNRVEFGWARPRGPASSRPTSPAQTQTQNRAAAFWHWSNDNVDPNPYSDEQSAAPPDTPVSFSLPAQHVMVLGPVQMNVIDPSAYGQGTANWLNYQTPDDGYTYPKAKKFSDPYAACLAGSIGVALRTTTIQTSFSSNASPMLQTTFDKPRDFCLNWPDAIVHAGGGQGSSVWFRSSSKDVLGGQQPASNAGSSLAPLPVLAPANPNWAYARASNVRALSSPALLNPWGRGGATGDSPLDNGASIWGTQCRGAGGGCFPTSSLNSCGTLGDVSRYGGCSTFSGAVPSHWSHHLQPNGDDLSITAGRLAAMIRPLGVVNWDGSVLGYDGKNVIVILQSSWLCASYYGCRRDTECGGDMVKGWSGPGTSLGTTDYSKTRPAGSTQPAFRTSIGVIPDIVSTMSSVGADASKGIPVTPLSFSTDAPDALLPVSGVQTCWGGNGESFAAFIACKCDRYNLPWLSGAGSVSLVLIKGVGSGGTVEVLDLPARTLVDPGRPNNLRNFQTGRNAVNDGSGLNNSPQIASSSYLSAPLLTPSLDSRGLADGVFVYVLVPGSSANSAPSVHWGAVTTGGSTTLSSVDLSGANVWQSGVVLGELAITQPGQAAHLPKHSYCPTPRAHLEIAGACHSTRRRTDADHRKR